MEDSSPHLQEKRVQDLLNRPRVWLFHHLQTMVPPRLRTSVLLGQAEEEQEQEEEEEKEEKEIPTPELPRSQDPISWMEIEPLTDPLLELHCRQKEGVIPQEVIRLPHLPPYRVCPQGRAFPLRVYPCLMYRRIATMLTTMSLTLPQILQHGWIRRAQTHPSCNVSRILVPDI